MAEHPSLLFGSMELYDPDASGYGVEVLVEGTSRGSAVPIREAIESFLEQGAIEVTQGWENRPVPIRVTFTAEDIGDLDALADAETALFEQIGIYNTLVWTPYHPDLPGDHLGTPVVFDVVNSQLDPVEGDRWDLDETDPRPSATYQIGLVCKSFVHSSVTTVVDALPAGGTTTTSIHDGASATGWTATFNGGAATPTVSSGKVRVVGTANMGGWLPAAPNEVVMVLPASAFPADTTTQKYVYVDYALEGPIVGVSAIELIVNGGAGTGTLISTYRLDTGTTRAVFQVNVNSTTALTFHATLNWSGYPGQPAPTIGVLVDQVSRTDVIPQASTARQLLRTFEVGGQAPAAGNIQLTHETSALGDVLMFTYPDLGTGYQPACRVFRVSGGTVAADANAVSGFSEPLNSSPTFDIPNGALDDGEYQVIIRSRNTTGVTDRTINWSVDQRMNGANIGNGESFASIIHHTTSYAFHRLGMIHLPLMDTSPHATAMQRIIIDDSSATGTPLLDELYLLNMTTGQLTQVSLGTGSPAAGGSSNRLWSDAPSLVNEGLGRLLRGFAADRSDAFSAHPSAEATGRHQFDPRQLVKVFTVTTNPSTPTAVRLEYEATALSRLRAGV